MTTEQMTTQLMEHGNLTVPYSRYGRDTAECVPVAISAAEAYETATGEAITPETLEWLMGLVVNDHDDIEAILQDCGS